MKIAVIGTGFVGSLLGRALSAAGNTVTFGSRHPESVDAELGSARVATIAAALSDAEVTILALPGAAVEPFAAQNAAALGGTLVIDATNRMGQPVNNSRADLPSSARYARAFNALGGENMANPVFADGRADMFFSAPEADRATVEAVIEGVGLQPVYVGQDKEGLMDCLFRLWVELAVTQGRGRRLALRLLQE
jgi:predicted dinucleotide-binding enzyme